MILLSMVTFLVFIGYNIVVQWYISHNLTGTGRFLIRTFVATAVNTLIFSGFIFFPNGYYEPISMVLFLLSLYFIATKFYSVGSQNALFITLSFGINLYAIRLFVRNGYSLFSGVSVDQTYLDSYHTLIIALISFAIPIPYILVTSKIITKNVIDLILVDRDNLKFSNSIMMIDYIYVILIYLMVLANGAEEYIPIVGIFVGVSAIAVYLVSLYYTKVLANLQLNVSQFEKLSEVVAVEERSVRELKENATTDELTGLKQRSVVEEIIKLYLERDKGFYVVLFDMDGLKNANDNYGHDEGDFYIKKASKILSVVFDEETVARIGGDEFMVVGNTDDEFACMKKVVTCHRKIKNIQREYRKPYKTSISYGVVLVASGSKHYSDFQEIYRLSDKRMYNFKKANKKERK